MDRRAMTRRAVREGAGGREAQTQDEFHRTFHLVEHVLHAKKALLEWKEHRVHFLMRRLGQRRDHVRKSPARMFPKRTAVKGRMNNLAGAEKDCFES